MVEPNADRIRDYSKMGLVEAEDGLKLTDAGEIARL